MKKLQYTLNQTKISSLMYLLIAWVTSSEAQFQFRQEVLTHSFNSGLPISAADVNGDYLPDLVILDKASELWLGINYGNARFNWSSLGFVSSHTCWSINVADIDNNGQADILIGGDARGLHVFYQEQGVFRKNIIAQSKFFSQAANLHDINQDGWLDACVCDDNDKMRLYLNDKRGRLLYDTNLIKFGLPNPEWNSGNYGSTWADYDRDGDADLYVAKCKAEVSDPEDGRRKNLFFIQDQKKFTEVGKLLKLDFGDQSWAAAFEDFNGDLLPDLVILNHYSPSRFLVQMRDHSFKEVTLETGIDFQGIPIQMVIEDWDNDGDQDILFAGTKIELYLNDGRMHFTRGFISFDQEIFNSLAVADFNQDGFPDIYASYAALLNDPSNRKDRLWMHPGNQNQFINLSFRGISSNSSGIGTQIELYAGQTKQYKELKSGSSFGLEHSRELHFGLGNNTIVDSILVYWPSGLIEKYVNIAANKSYLFTEGKCMSELSFPLAREINLCKEETVYINSDLNQKIKFWNNGKTGDSIEVSQTGIYFSHGFSEDSCYQIGNLYYVRRDPLEKISLDQHAKNILCAGEELLLELNGYDIIEWQDGTKAASYLAKESGIYYAQAKGSCSQLFSDTVEVIVKEHILPHRLPEDTTIFTRTFNYFADNDIFWYDSENALPEKFFAQGNLQWNMRSNTDTLWSNRISVSSFPSISAGLAKPEYIRAAYNAEFVNGQMLFLVFENFVIDSITVFTDFPGKRKLVIRDPSSNIVFEREYEIGIGETSLYIGAELQKMPGYFTILFDEEENKKQFGNISPKMQRSDKGFTYPISLGKLGELVSSHIGEDYYYYFYNWRIRRADKWCVSERDRMVVHINTSKTQEAKHNLYYREEAGNLMVFQTANSGFYMIKVFDLQGRQILVDRIESGIEYVFNAANLTPGLYIFQFTGVGMNAALKIYLD